MTDVNIDRLRVELAGFPFLSLPVRMSLETWAAADVEGRAAAVQAFFDDHLPRLRQLLANVNEPTFYRLCDNLRDIPDAAVIARVLGGTEAPEWLEEGVLTPYAWFLLRRFQTNPDWLAYCYLNELTTLGTLHGVGVANRFLDVLWMEAGLALTGGNVPLLLRNAAELYGFPSEGPRDRACWEAVVAKWSAPPYNRLVLGGMIPLLGALRGEGLRARRREGQSMAGSDLVGESIDFGEALLGLQPEDKACTPGELADRFDGLLSSWVAELVANADSAPGGDSPDVLLCRVLVATVTEVARGYLARNECRHALHLIGSVLRLYPAPCGELEGFEQRRRLVMLESAQSAARLWAELLIREGCLEQAVAELLPLLGFPSQPTDCPPAWRGPLGDSWAILAVGLGGALVAAGRPQDCVDLLLSLMGLPDGELRRRNSLQMRDLALHHIEPHLVTDIVCALVEALVPCGECMATTNLVEVAWQIEPEDYASPWRLRQRLKSVWRGDEPSTHDRLALCLTAISQLQQGRFLAAAATAMVAAPELHDSSLLSFGELRKQFAHLPQGASHFLISIICRVHLLSDPRLVVRLLTESLGVTVEDLPDKAISCSKIAATLRALGQPIVMNSVSILHTALGQLSDEEPYRAALVGLGEALFDLPLTKDSPVDRYTLVLAAIQLAGTHLEVGRSSDALTLLEREIGLRPEHYRTKTGLRDCLESVGMSEFVYNELRGMLLPVVAGVLHQTERHEDLDALYHSQIESLDWLDPEDHNSPPLSCADLALVVLGLFGTRYPDLVFRLGDRYLRYFRSRLLGGNISVGDRQVLISYTARFRAAILTQGNNALARGAGREERLRLLILDQELGQRRLLERLLLEAPPGMDSHAEKDTDHQVKQAPPRPPAASQVLPVALELRDAASVQRPFRPPAATEPQIATGGAFDVLLREGLDEASLAATLGESELFLRAGMSEDGRLIWALFEREEPDILSWQSIADSMRAGRLRLLASDGGRNDPSQATRIEAAISRHDHYIAAAWERMRFVGLCAQPVGQGIVSGRGEAVLAELVGTRDEFERHFPTMLHALAEHQVLSTLITSGPVTEAPVLLQEWTKFMREQTQLARDAVLQGGLDRATLDFLREVSDAWGLESLREHLSVDRDLVVQFDGVLHGLPPGFLLVGEQFLVERVRSVRVVFSLLQNEYLTGVEAEVVKEVFGPDEPRRVIGISSFGQGETSASVAAHRMLEGLWDLSQTEPLAGQAYHLYGNEYPTPGSMSMLAEILGMGGAFQILMLLAHGARASGVQFSDGRWTGWELIDLVTGRTSAGCDLRLVEFLIQVSCSVGRPDNSVIRGVEGFCVELTAARARSVLAGLWQLHCHDAVAFAIAVAGAYLPAREQERQDNPHPQYWASARLRAKAVAEVQREWLKQSRRAGNPVPRRLNTMAGFVMFNLG